MLNELKITFFVGDSSVKAIFGTNLVEHLRVTGRKIAYPLELCICALTELGMTEEGILRVAGGSNCIFIDFFFNSFYLRNITS